MKKLLTVLQLFLINLTWAQNLTTVFETSDGKATVTYEQCIQFYQQLAKQSAKVQLHRFDTTDAGEPLHVVLLSNQMVDIKKVALTGKLVVLVNNGIHPGEPDGIDASMLLARNIATGKVYLPNNMVLAIIPIYNIGGALNRSSFSRVNQNGPIAYGFRGNAQNLDLNRDFIKMDSKDAFAFVRIFHTLKPHVFIDNHVSDGADYQHTFTLLSTQHSKLGSFAGKYLHESLEPTLYEQMKLLGWPIIPYVNFETALPQKGWPAFFDAPRYSCGYTTLFGTIGFTPETHMLKPYPQRVQSTYDFMLSIIRVASTKASEIVHVVAQQRQQTAQQQVYPLTWKLDTSKHQAITFKGYGVDTVLSEVTGMKRIKYNHDKPYEKEVLFYNYYQPNVLVTKPKAYLLPQGWHQVVDRLQANGVAMYRLTNDTVISVAAYYIQQYQSSSKPYEKHHRNTNIKLVTKQLEMQFRKGDWVIPCGKWTDRYVVETLEPLGDDSFFSWNFFDAILQQKEGYSDYRWEDVAAQFLQDNPTVKAALEAKKREDAAFAKDASAQLYFVYQQSPWYEPVHMRYPVFRLVE
jgi:hypothetical protein